MDIMLERVLDLVAERNINQKDLTDFLGISSNSFTNWKSGLNSSYKKYKHAIAEFFNVSVEYLMGETDEKNKPLINGDEELTRYLEELRNRKEMRVQEETQYELLETKKYTQGLFDRRNKALRDKMSKCEEQIAECKKTMPEAVDYEKRIATLQNAIKSLKDKEISAIRKNAILKTIIGRIDCKSEPHQSHGQYDFSITIKLKI